MLGVALVAIGVVIEQFTIYGPSLLGNRVILPLDILRAPGIYLPTSQASSPTHESGYLSDLILASEPMRRFAQKEFNEGRLPMWAPYQYAGVPFCGPKFSPFVLPQYLIASPVVLSWVGLAGACLSGIGMYAFCRQGLRLSVWPSVICGWCYPLSGFFVLWHGTYVVPPIYLLPLLLLSTDSAVRGKNKWGGLCLALMTCLTVLSGALDIAGQALMTSGIYAFLLVLVRARWQRDLTLGTLTRLGCAYLFGLMLSAPYLLPTLDYAKSGARIHSRAQGSEERPPAGLDAAPQIVLPDMYGAQARSRTGYRFHGESNQLESTGTAYAGAVATLVLAPLAFADRRRRPLAIALAVLGFLSLSWSLKALGFVHVLRLPPLNMMSHNRWVFVAAFVFACLAGLALERICRRKVAWGRPEWLALGLGSAVLLWAAYRTVVPPLEIRAMLPEAVEAGRKLGWIQSPTHVQEVQALFRLQYLVAALFIAGGIGLLLLALLFPRWQRRLLPAFGFLLLLELLWFAHGRNPQTDPSLYYPPIPALTELAQDPGKNRVLGYQCLPPLLNSTVGLDEVRGYDAVDPARYVELLTLAAGPASVRLGYAAVQFFVPELDLAARPENRLSPVLNLLGVSHVIFRGSPPPHVEVAYQSPDYWVWRNPSALPRAFVPSRVELADRKEQRLQRLADRAFDPSTVAFVEVPVDLPTNCVGSVDIVDYQPCQVRLAVRMQTPGLVVLTDRWDKGWKARLNGEEQPILLVNHALRGVLVGPGAGALDFHYEPRSFAMGLRLALAALLLLGLWVGWLGFRNQMVRSRLGP